jgi:hypothetical protein
MSMSNATKRVKEIRIVLDGLRDEPSIAEK